MAAWRVSDWVGCWANELVGAMVVKMEAVSAAPRAVLWAGRTAYELACETAAGLAAMTALHSAV